MFNTKKSYFILDIIFVPHEHKTTAKYISAPVSLAMIHNMYSDVQ